MNLGIDNWVAWFSVFVQYILCNSLECYLFVGYIHLMNCLVPKQVSVCCGV